MIIPATIQPTAPLVVRPTRSAQGPSIENRQPNFFILKLLSVKIKKCGNRSYRTQKRNPDCRQTSWNGTRQLPYLPLPGICVFSKFIESGSTNRYSIPKGNYTCSIIQLVWHKYDTIPIRKNQFILETSAFSLSFWYVILTENRKGWERYGIQWTVFNRNSYPVIEEIPWSKRRAK